MQEGQINVQQGLLYYTDKPAYSELNILLPSCCCCSPTDNLENNRGISSSPCCIWGSCVLRHQLLAEAASFCAA